jgi:zeta-carotene desaturase
LSTAVELCDRGYEVEIFESRPFVGGKVGSWRDADGNHIEMGLHVFFGCYYNLFNLMQKVGAFEHLLRKEHTHTFINRGGRTGELDFRNFGGAPFHGLKAFFTTSQLSLKDKIQNAIALGTSPIVRALVDPKGALDDIHKLDNQLCRLVPFPRWFPSQP